MKYVIMLISLLISGNLFALNDTIQVKSKISNATVFFSGAQLSRTASISLKKGSQLLVFESLAADLDPSSLQVDRLPFGQILFVKHELYHSKGNAALYDQKKDEIAAIELEIDYIKNEIQILKIEEQMLLDNSTIQKGENGALVEDLREAAAFYRKRLTGIRRKMLEGKQSIKNKEKALQAVYIALNKYKSETTKTYSRVWVSVESFKDQSTPLVLSYYIDNAGWSPQYDFRVEDVDKPLKVVYQANVFQTSGEKWEDVQLKLSTGEPSLSNQKPEFEDWIVYEDNPYIKPNTDNGKKISTSKGVLKGIVVDSDGEPLPFANVLIKGTERRGAITDMDGVFAFKPIEDGWHELEISFIGYETTNIGIRVRNGVSDLNKYVVSESSLALSEVNLVAANVVHTRVTSRPLFSVEKTGIVGLIGHSFKETINHFEYDIEQAYTILSDTEAQQIKIKEVEVVANYAYHAMPRLDKDVFLVAEIPEWNQLQLLSAPLNIYNQGTYSGASYIDADFPGDTLEVSLGRDRNIVVTQKLIREKNDKRILGGNIKENIAWEIVVKNNKRSAVRIIVEDQHPITEHKSVDMEIVVPEIASHDEKRGIIRWEMEMPAGDKKELNYEYTVKYDKRLSLNLR